MMALIPLLPQSDNWPRQASSGLHSITDQDYQRNLSESYYEASDYGIPSPLGQARVFAYRLEQYLLDIEGGAEESDFEDSFEVWTLLLQGLYLGVVETRDIDLDKLRALGEIVRADLPDDFPLRFLLFGDRVIGLTFPRIGFTPSVRFGGDVREALRIEVERKAGDKAGEYLAGWVHTFDEEDQGDLPFYRLLYKASARWAPGAPETLPYEPEVLFGDGAELWLGGDDLAEHINRPRLPLYQGTPVICDHCGHEIGRDTGYLEVKTPEECRCPECQTEHDWLAQYSSWIQYDEEKGCFLIYALEGSPALKSPLWNSLKFDNEGVVIHDGGFALKVQGLVFTEDALKCSRLTFFRDGERLVEPHLPVRGEYYGLVAIDERRRPVRDRRTGDYIVRLKVHGWSEPVTLHYRAKEIHHEEALLLTWPNFNRPGWNIYYYLLEKTAQMNKAGLKLRALGRREQPRMLDESRGQTTSPFEAFEMVFCKEGDVVEEAGIFETARVDQEQGKAPITLALDFGTSATTVWYRVGDGDSKVLRFRDFTETLVPNKELSTRALNRSYWVPTYRLDDPQTASAFYRQQLDEESNIVPRPEEIVAKLDHFLPSEMILSGAEGLDKPLSGFRICHAYAANPHGEVIFEIKTQPVEGDPEGRFSYENAVTKYLEVFLVQALATIINTEPRAGHLKLRVSFPRAFSSAKIDRYLKCIDRITTHIQDLTGFPTNSIHYIDEARAAALSMKVPEGFSLVMDMGGGTTDLGLFEWQEGDLKPVFVDSLLYGGNSFLRILADKDQADLFPKPTEKVSFNHRLLWLFREIRLRGFDTVVNTQYTASKNSRKAMLDLLLRFYSPLALFASRLFEALSLQRKSEEDLRKSPVSYYLVGNGWSLADALPAPDSGGYPGRLEIFGHLLRQQGFTNLTAVKRPSIEGWPGPKGAVGYGAISAEERLLYPSIQDAAGDANGVRTVSGFDFYLTDGDKDRTQVDWHQEIPLPIDKRDLRPVLSEIELPEEWRDFIRFEKGGTVHELESVCAEDIEGVDHPRLTRSPLARFLEKIYREQLPRARRH
jgi:hypothetical protein